MRCRGWVALRARAAVDRAFLCRLGVECGLDVVLTLAALLHALRARPRAQRLRSALWQASIAAFAGPGQSVGVAQSKCLVCVCP